MFKIDWNEFLKSNDLAKKNIGKATKMRIIEFTNNGKTCCLKDLDNNKNACMDIAHIIVSVRKGTICLTNPSILKSKIGQV